ncbi:MAG: helix-turn-helix transcriptional regulator [Alteromonadaceae bacterium]|nr:helix-turn-helix transcriptional regulator [Alteromonadaceae bacterium]
MSEVFLATLATAVAGFTLMVLPMQTSSPSKMPLMLVLVCLGLLSTGPVIFAFLPWLTQLYISVLPLLFFLLLPGLWFYHEALIAEHQWHWTPAMYKHLLPLPFMAALGGAIFHLPEPLFTAMFFSGQSTDELYIHLLSSAFFAAVLLWCVLSGCYIVMLLRRTVKYRNQLKDVFSNEQGKRLSWLNGVSLLIGFSWVYALLVLIFEDTYTLFGVSENGVLVLLVTIVWVMCANGLRQRPGFEDNPPPTQNTAHELQQSTKSYERSALTHNDLAAIAERLTSAIDEKKAYLDPDLTLAKLSAIVSEPSQYISQTLSQHLRTTFFDLINTARIDSAKLMLAETNQSVLDVALATGFNSRSSFYNAFRKYTGLTPGQYRKAQKT